MAKLKRRYSVYYKRTLELKEPFEGVADETSVQPPSLKVAQRNAYDSHHASTIKFTIPFRRAFEEVERPEVTKVGLRKAKIFPLIFV